MGKAVIYGKAVIAGLALALLMGCAGSGTSEPTPSRELTTRELYPQYSLRREIEQQKVAAKTSTFDRFGNQINGYTPAAGRYAGCEWAHTNTVGEGSNRYSSVNRQSANQCHNLWRY